MKINGKEYLDCPDCPQCKPQDTLINGARWGVCGMGGNTVYLEPWKEKRANGSGYIITESAVVDFLKKRKRVKRNDRERSD